MAPPQKKAVAPGTQVIRSDADKERSWADPHFKPPPLVGRVFFKTNDATLDDDDMKQLEKLLLPYRQKLSLGKPVYFEYLGYADYRYTRDHNDKLSQRRADAVANFLGQPMRFGDYPDTYRPTVQGRGIDYDGIREPPNSKALSIYRRVDIHADPLADDPKPTQPAPDDKLSTRWKARIYDCISAGPPGAIPVTADVFSLEIVDLTNNLAMNFKYRGGGFGKSFKGLPGTTLTTSDWYMFKTLLKYHITDFEGDAAHYCQQLQAGPGYCMDAVNLWGKSSKRIAPRVKMVWEGFTKLDKAAGVGVSATGGILLPDPAGQKPYWPPRV